MGPTPVGILIVVLTCILSRNAAREMEAEMKISRALPLRAFLCRHAVPEEGCHDFVAGSHRPVPEIGAQYCLEVLRLNSLRCFGIKKALLNCSVPESELKKEQCHEPMFVVDHKDLLEPINAERPIF